MSVYLVGQVQDRLSSEDQLISEFAATTARLRGDRQRYAQDALTLIREAHGAAQDSLNFLEQYLDLLDQSVIAAEDGDENSANQLYQQAIALADKVDGYARAEEWALAKATDAMKMLEAVR